MDIDQEGNVYLSGSTKSADFPVSANAFDKSLNGIKDGFFAKLNPDFSRLLYSRYNGGSKEDSLRSIHSIAGAPNGAVAVCGGSVSRDFPLFRAQQTTPGHQIVSLFTP